LEIFFHELSMYEEKIFLKRYKLEQDLLLKTYHEMLREASESERPELRQKLDDLLFNEERPYDRIRLGLPGWKSRFFREYFGAETSNEIGKLQNDMAQKYLEGLCWVLQCYFADVPSWSWYYPFYVAPFVSDLKGLSRVDISFTVDKPLRPFDQLMAVLPMQSWCALPKCYKEMMGRKEFDYPRLEHDTKGRHFLWNGISEELLLSATKVVDKKLTTHESRRNTTRQEKIFLHRDSSSLPHNEVTEQTSHCSVQKLPIDSATSGIGGWIAPDDNDGFSDGSFHSPTTNLQDITSDQTISGTFFNPEAANPVPRLLRNVSVPDKTVTGADISKRPLWHTYPGSRPPRIIQRPDTIWKPSTPASPREEHKNAGTGWIGRGKGNALATAETHLKSSSNSYRRGGGFHRVGMAQSRGSSSRFDDDGAYSFRPLGSAPWTAGDSSRSGGAGHGGIAQPRGW